MEFNRQIRIIKSSDAEEYALDDGSLVVYKASTEFTHVFNETAAFLWKECDMKCFNDIVELFISNLSSGCDGTNHEVLREEIIKDCEELFVDMMNKELVMFDA
ncbi:MAG TPA: hypothetical protein VIO64_08930 [Pseudobacteroides sp.]|uniref:hypothetical protein n=1 Tax=Pseudobacteroides sp. TaxID=1968840 RepID=UPI002F91F395